jgi:hypothetical protein
MGIKKVTMKHLKTYKIFESIDILNDIRDILRQLDDLDYSTYVQWTPLTIAGNNKKKELSIQINKMNKDSFIGSEEDLETIILTFEHLESFLSDSNFEIKNFFFDNSSYNILTNSFIGSNYMGYIPSRKSFREIFTEFYESFLNTHKGDIGDYMQLTLKEK